MSDHYSVQKNTSNHADEKAYWVGFGRRLQRIRKERGFTGECFARHLGMSPVFIRQIECGMKHPSISTLVTFARELQVSADVLLDTAGSAELIMTRNPIKDKQSEISVEAE